MSLLSRLVGWFRSLENPRRPLDPWSNALSDSLDGSVSLAGVRVGREKAHSSAGFWRGVNLISGTVAKLPLGVCRRLSPGSEPDPRHPAHRLLKRSPNECMTSFVWKRLMQAHAICHGNGYSYIGRSVGGAPLELLPLDPERTYPVRQDKRLFYVHELKGGERRKLDPQDVLHLKGYGFDGLEGYPVLQKARETLGLDLATRGYASTFFRNNARPNVALKHPSRLSPEARRNLRESWERLYSGFENAHRAAILEEGLELQELTINARDSQLLESRQFTLIEIANFLGIPPHKLGAATNVSYKSLEQENQAYLDDAIDPWLVMWEEECEAKLLGLYQRERETHAVCFDRFPLVRADLQQRGGYYVQALSNGWMSTDEVRAREGLNPLPAGLGGLYYRPGNLLPVNADPDGAEGPGVAPGAELLDLPDLRQEGDFDCGPAAVQAVCQFFGVGPASRAEYVEALGTTRERGTSPAAVLDLLSRTGLAATAKAGLTVADLARFFAAGHPVLCPVQAGDPGQETGHWVAVIGVGLGQVFVHDPAAGRRRVSEEEWLSRWHDRDASGAGCERFGIAVGRELYEPPAPLAEDDPDPDPAPEPEPSGENGDRADAIRGAAGAHLAGEVLRMVRRVATHVRRAAGKPSQFLAAVDALEGDHLAVITAALRGPADVLRAAGLGEPDHALAARTLLGELREGLLELAGQVRPDGLAAEVGRYFESIESRPETLRAFRAIMGGEL